MTTKKTPARRASQKASSPPKSMPAEGKDPHGGLTAKGREYFNKKEGSHLRPGVRGPADTPEKMVRKGSFLRRHFANPRGPMKDDKGEATRLALSAHAWGEPVPQTMGDARKLADEGHELLEQYHEIKGDKPRQAKKSSRKASSKAAATRSKPPVKKAAKKVTSSGANAKRSAPKKAAKKAAAKTGPAKKGASKKPAAKHASGKQGQR